MKLYQSLTKSLVCMVMCLATISQSQAQSTLNNLVNTISISTLNKNMYESWPSPSVVVVRRTGDLRAVTIPLTITGTATPGLDYLSSVGGSVTIPMGKKEVWIQFVPIKDLLAESTENIRIALKPLPAYNLTTDNFVELNIIDNTFLPVNDEAN